MITSNRRWWLVASAAFALTVPAVATPAHAAPDDTSPLVKARKTWADLNGRVSAADVSDGYPGGIQIAAGGTSSCSSATTTLWCWGNGDGTPARVTMTQPYSVTAGRAHTCALETFDESDDGGNLFCWGENAEGQVGDGTTTTRTTPVRVAQDVRQVAAGADHTCAIVDDQTVRCWGRNDMGQLGSGTAGASVDTPQPVPGLTDVIGVAAGGDTTCAIDEDGKAWCWGSNSDGQVGDGTTGVPAVPTPTQVLTTGISDDLTQIEVGRTHTCALTEDNDAYCWGSDSHGQLGNDAALTPEPQPVPVSENDLQSISAGGDTTCAVDGNGQAFCWGDNTQGQLGVGDNTDRPEPAEVDQSGLSSVSFFKYLIGAGDPMMDQVSVGDGHVCGLDVLGNPFCWGDNADGQLGDGSTTDHPVPAGTLLLPGPVTKVAARPGDTKLMVSWTAPELELGTVTAYGAYALSDTAAGRCFVAKPGCTITELVNGDEYQVLVFAITTGGASFADAVPAIPLAASTPPVSSGGRGGGQLPITGAAVSLLILIGGGLVLGGMLLRRRFR